MIEPRSGRSVAALSWVFTQRAPLDTEDVLREAQRWRVKLDAAMLRALYRSGDLQPLLEVRARPHSPPHPETRDEPEAQATVLRDLRQARREGRLTDPAWLPYRRRLRFDRRTRRGPRVWWNGLVYSNWQLLALPHLRSRLAEARPCGTSRARWYKLPPSSFADQELAVRLRRVALVLTGLEARYWPNLDREFIHVTNADPDDWRRYRDATTAADLSTALDYSAAQAYTDAEWLLIAASDIDPTGDWSKLLRRAPHRTWSSLTGDALAAIEYRAGAEILLSFAEDLAAVGLGEPLPQTSPLGWHPLTERLSHRPEQLSEVLQELGVSPHPRAVLVLEGHTEAHLAPRVFEALHIALEPGLIHLANMAGVNRDLSLLAGFAVAPLLGNPSDNHYRPLRPLTRLIVAVDPDHGWSTPEEVEDRRESIMMVLRAALDAQNASVHDDDLEQLVHLHTWSASCFEYAHFTDGELARGLRQVHPDCGGLTIDQLEDALGRHRQAGDDIKKVWKNWRAREPSKVKLADALWPVLRERIVTANHPDDLPAIARIVDEAYLLAQQHRHDTVVLRVSSTHQPGPATSDG